MVATMLTDSGTHEMPPTDSSSEKKNATTTYGEGMVANANGQYNYEWLFEYYDTSLESGGIYQADDGITHPDLFLRAYNYKTSTIRIKGINYTAPEVGSTLTVYEYYGNGMVCKIMIYNFSHLSSTINQGTIVDVGYGEIGGYMDNTTWVSDLGSWASDPWFMNPR